MSKNNVPYYTAGTLAALTLLASGVFAAAPYIGFLAPVAALSVGLPFIISGAIISAVAIALSAVAISKNKTISEKDTQLADEKSKAEAKEKAISEKEAEVQAQKKTISEKDVQFNQRGTEISNLKGQLADQAKEIEELKRGNAFVPQAIKNIKEASQEVFAYVAEAYSSGRVHSTIKQRCSDVANDLKNVVGSAKNAYGTSVESAKGTLSGIGNKLKCDTMPSAESARNLVPSLKTVSWLAGGGGAGAAYIAANGGFTVAGNSSNAVSNSTNSTESGVLIPNSSSVCYRPTYQQIMQGQIDEYSKTLAYAEKFAENNFGMSEKDNTNNKNEPQNMISKIFLAPRSLWSSVSNFISGGNKSANDEPQWYKDLRKSEDPEEIMDGGTMFNEENNSTNHTYSNNTIGANDPAQNCKVTRGSNKHTAKNETSTPCSINEYEVKTNLGNVNLCCALPTVSMSEQCYL